MSSINQKAAVLLEDTGVQSLYWLTSSEDTAFKTNAYLQVSGNEAVLHDPGGAPFFEHVSSLVDEIVGINAVKAITFSHQDPDVTSSLPEWLKARPDLDFEVPGDAKSKLPTFPFSTPPNATLLALA